MKMWSGRFREPLDHDFEQWQRSLAFDWRLLPQEVAASKAHARTIAAANILTTAELQQIVTALDAIRDEYAGRPASDISGRVEAEDIHHFVELELTARIGDLGFKLHTGRSRNEQIATDLRLYVREQCATIAGNLAAWCVALATQAKSAGDAGHAGIHPFATGGTRAGGALAPGLRRDAVTRYHPAGGFEPAVELLSTGIWRGCGRNPQAGPDNCRAGTAFHHAPTANSMDATSDRDFALEFLQALTLVAVHASRFAEEITLYATAEFGFVELPEAFSTGSSAMPQKKNPDLTELVRGQSRPHQWRRADSHHAAQGASSGL